MVTLVTRRRGALLLSVAVIAYPLVHFMTPVAGYVRGPLSVLLAPLAALVLAQGHRNRTAVAAAFAVVIALTTGDLTNMH